MGTLSDIGECNDSGGGIGHEHYSESQIWNFLDKKLSTEDSLLAAEHLETCKKCKNFFYTIQETRYLIARVFLHIINNGERGGE